MICHQRRVIFVHIPKTAGQSIEQVFLADCGYDWSKRARLLMGDNLQPLAGPPFLAHLFADEYVTLGYVSAAVYAQYLTCSVVRNPWDRAVSEYKYFYRDRMDFRTFVSAAYPAARGSNEARHLAPQWRFIESENGIPLVDHVLRYEHLAADFTVLSAAIFGAPRPLPRVNISPDATPYRAFYNADTWAVIAKRYARDIDTYGYRF